MNSFINDLIYDLKQEIKNKKNNTDKSILKNIQVNKRQYRMVGKFVNSKRYSKNEKDLMIISLIMHDGLKSGLEKSQYTKFEHPLLVCDYIKENKDKLTFTDKEIEFMCHVISSHMGPWNTNNYSTS